MPNAISSLDSPVCFCLLPGSSNGLFQDPQSNTNLLFRDLEARHEAQRVGARGNDQQAPLARGFNHRRRVLGHLQSQNQAPAAHLLDEVREALPHLGEAGAKNVRLGADVGLQRRVGQLGDHVVGEAAGERVAAKSGAVVADGHLVGDAVVDEHGADGEAVAEGLGRRQDIRVRLLGQVAVRPELAGAAEAALNLVVDEHGADGPGTAGEGDQKVLAGRLHAALALDGLDDDGARLFRHERVDARHVIVRALPEAGHHGRKGLLVLWVVRRRQRAHGASVKRIVKRDDLGLAARRVQHLADLARKLDGSLVGLGPGVAHKHPGRVVHAARRPRHVHQQLGQRAGPGVVVQVGRVDERLRLLRQQRREFRVAVAERRDGDAGGKVEVRPARVVVQPGARAPDKDGRRPRVRGHHVGRVPADERGTGRVGWGVGVGELCVAVEFGPSRSRRVQTIADTGGGIAASENGRRWA